MKQKNIGMKIIRKLIDFIVGSGNKQSVKNPFLANALLACGKDDNHM